MIRAALVGFAIAMAVTVSTGIALVRKAESVMAGIGVDLNDVDL